MASLVYGLCALTSLLCACLLILAYRRNGCKLLLWSGLCFAGLTLNNVLLVVDKVILPLVDLSTWRHLIGLVAMLILLYGLIWEAE
ncbi:MAG: DUF5985 family protein [Pseudomonadota bacterium]